MREIRALMMTPYGFWTGGVAAYVNALVPILVDAGIKPTVLTTSTMSPTYAKWLEDHGATPVETNTIGTQTPKSQPFYKRPLVKHLEGTSLFKRMRAGRYDVVHVNASSPWFQSIAIHAAKRAGIPVRISHCHGDPGDEGIRSRVTHALHLTRLLREATHLMACSSEAGRFLFGDRAWERRGIFAKNGIDTARFAFRKDVRERLRAGCPDAFVVGNVARLSPEKNLTLLVEAFAEVLRLRPDARLWLVGSGPGQEPLVSLARRLGLEDYVTFWGDRDDVPDLLQAMDCFVLPSLVEGLGIALIEAQAAGLPCVASSEGVPPEADVPGCLVERVSLGASPGEWARRIVGCAGKRGENGDALVRAAGFDVEESGNLMVRIYRGEAL